MRTTRWLVAVFTLLAILTGPAFPRGRRRRSRSVSLGGRQGEIRITDKRRGGAFSRGRRRLGADFKEKNLRAELLEWLLTDLVAQTRISPRGVRIERAKLIRDERIFTTDPEKLVPSRLNLTGAKLEWPLHLEKCEMTELTIRLCRLGDVELTACKCGKTNFNETRFNGHLLIESGTYESLTLHGVAIAGRTSVSNLTGLGSVAIQSCSFERELALAPLEIRGRLSIAGVDVGRHLIMGLKTRGGSLADVSVKGNLAIANVIGGRFGSGSGLERLVRAPHRKSVAR